MARVVYLYVIPLSLTLVFCGRAEPGKASPSSVMDGPMVAEIATNYLRLPQLTREAVQIRPELANACASLLPPGAVIASQKPRGPHTNSALIIHMNPLASDAFARKTTPYPVGSVIVKRKRVYASHDFGDEMKNERAVGGMIKRAPGYDPEHGDWEYFYFEQSTKIEQGRLSSCIECHASAEHQDHVFGSWQKSGGQAMKETLPPTKEK